MGRGLLSGVFWGSLLSVVVLGTISLLAPQAGPELPLSAALGRGVAPEIAGAAVDGGPGVTGADGAQDVARLETPAAETTPVAAAEPAGAAAPAAGPVTEAASGVDVPAGSDFRKALPETAAEVPSSDGAQPNVSAPEAPARSAGDVALASAGAEAPRRPDTPGMSVQAPTPPAAEEDTTAPAAVAPEADRAPMPAAGPVLSPADTGEPTLESDLAKGFPPAVRSEVAETAVPAERVVTAEAVSGGIAETGTPAAEAEIVSGSPAEATEVAGASATSMATAPAEKPDTVAGVVTEASAPAQEVTAGVAGSPETADQPLPDGAVSGVVAEVPASPDAAQGEQIAASDPASEGPATPEALAPSGETAPATTETPPQVSAVVPRTPVATSPATEPAGSATVPSQTPSAAGEEVAQADVDGSATGGFGRHVQPLTERKTMGSRLPQIGVTVAPPAEDVAEAAAPTSEAPSMDELTRNARPFTNLDGKPLFSVILIDDGTAGLDRSVLTTFPFPVTFAIDPTRTDAAEAAAEFAGAGFEVVALATGLPEGATARDVEVTLGAHLARVPQAVAIMDPPVDGLAGRRELAQQALDIAESDGYGVIGWSRGLDALDAAARKGDLPVALVYRAVDAQGENSSTIERYLDRAAFKAAQDGTVVMVGHNRPDTVTALFEWSVGGKAGQVALAPISAVLRQP